MKAITTSIIFFCLLLVSSCTKPKNESISLEDMQKTYNLVIKDKYKTIKSFEELLIATDLFFNEHYSSHMNNVSDQIADNTYKYEEELYLLDNLSKLMEKHPKTIIPKLISFYQFSGCAIEEYITESLRMFFDQHPRVFIESMDKRVILQNLEAEFRNDDYLYNTIYPGLSEPLSEEYINLSVEKQKEYVVRKIKDLNIKNDFYLFLGKEYKF
jgi:hypothetical protein